jgi:hypothetical protein
MVIIQGKPEEFDDIDRVPGTAEAIATKHGPEMVARLRSLGWKFDIGANES